MKRITRTNQGGSVVTFAVVGAILVVLLAGGIYYAYQRGSQVRTGEPLIGSTEHKTAAPSTPKSTDNSGKSSDKSDSTGQPQPQTSTTTPEPNTQSPSPSSTGSSSSQASGKIPQTGPADTMYLLVSVAIVAFATARYLRSRASLRTL